jgi:2-oxoglutarate dehydrogenase E2 component (dihydrolipoamide succinyltransferase)
MAEITMPQLGETVTEGTITKWFKAVGDQVAEDEILFEVSTDKVDSEVPSPVSGFLTEIRVQEGETVDVGVTLAVVGDQAAGDGEAAPAAEAPAAEPAPAEEAAAPVEDEQATTDQAMAAGEADDAAGEGREPEVEETPAPTAEAPAPAPAPAPADQAPAPPAEDGQAVGGNGAAPAAGESRLLSPVVRRLITEHGLDPASIQGTGAGGRITRSDVLARIEGADGGGVQQPAPAAPAAKAAPAPAGQAQPAPVARATPAPAAAPGERDEVVPFTNIRRRTAEHMVRSKATSAHTLIVIEVDYDGLERVRQPVRESFKAEEGTSLTYLPFVSRAVVDAIRDFPHVNASVGDNELIVHRDVHLSVAVDIDFEGLVAPVVHGADGKRLRALAREIADLATRARSKKLGPDDISGGTFTITNAGPWGTFITGAIINQPQVAILATDGVKKRPVVVELPDGSDAIAVHPTGMLALTFDHRAFDGAYAAAFLARVKEIIETRDWAAELT